MNFSYLFSDLFKFYNCMKYSFIFTFYYLRFIRSFHHTKMLLVYSSDINDYITVFSAAQAFRLIFYYFTDNLVKINIHDIVS